MVLIHFMSRPWGNITIRFMEPSWKRSMSFFIRECLAYSGLKEAVIFEAGFGTGLNVLLTLQAAIKHGITIEYYSIDKYPLLEEEWRSLNHGRLPGDRMLQWYTLLHESPWEIPCILHPRFTLHKLKQDLVNFRFSFRPDLVYFDAFSPDVQPDLWTAEVFSEIYRALKPGGILTTYSVKGSVRRTLTACGFTTGKIKGPPGKREMLRATK